MSIFSTIRRYTFLDAGHSTSKRIVVTVCVSIAALTCALTALFWGRSEEWFWLVFAALAMYLSGYWAIQIGKGHMDAATAFAFMATVVFCGMLVNYISSITTAAPLNRQLQSILLAQAENKTLTQSNADALTLKIDLMNARMSSIDAATTELLTSTKSANEREQKYQQAMENWRNSVQQIRETHARAVNLYNQQVADRLVQTVTIARGERGKNFRMDFPRGTSITFELSTGGVCRLKRDKPHGTDPDIFNPIRNGQSFSTTWDAGCENCNFYLKQDTDESMTIRIWKGGPPERPQQPSLPPEPTR